MPSGLRVSVKQSTAFQLFVVYRGVYPYLVMATTTNAPWMVNLGGGQLKFNIKLSHIHVKVWTLCTNLIWRVSDFGWKPTTVQSHIRNQTGSHNNLLPYPTSAMTSTSCMHFLIQLTYLIDAAMWRMYTDSYNTRLLWAIDRLRWGKVSTWDLNTMEWNFL